MARKNLDQISYKGEIYGFVDQEARDNVTSLSATVNSYNTARKDEIEAEIERAKNAEKALELTKMSVDPNKGLSTHDFNDYYKRRLDNYPPFEFGTLPSGALGGINGLVKGPNTPADMMKFLRGDNTWQEIEIPEYEPAEPGKDGLMSGSDKAKLDMLGSDEARPFTTTFMDDGSIHLDYSNGDYVYTYFLYDGRIMQHVMNPAVGAKTVYYEFVENRIEKTVVNGHQPVPSEGGAV